MKTKKIIAALAVCAVLAATSIGFAACGDNNEVTKTPLHLEVPTNVTIVDGGNDYSNDDDYVTFTAVDYAVSYQLFVWQEGDTDAKVVESDTTTIYMPSDLTAGTYYISVRAVGDKISYDFSNGSETATYTCKTTEQETGVVLGEVSNVALDFSTVDDSNAQYPVITFDAVDGAARYSAYLYEATVSGNDYTKTGDSVTNFNIPANSTTTTDGKVTYMVDQTTFGDLHPGYYVAEVYTRGDGEYYLDSEGYGTGSGAWLGYTSKTAEFALSVNSDGDTATVTLDNPTDFYVGNEFTVKFYSDEDCTISVGELTFSYSGSSISFGKVSYSYSNNTFSVTDNAIVKDTTYYYTATLNGDEIIYNTTSYSGSVTATETASSSGGMMGGDMGGGGGDAGNNSDWAVSASGSFDWDTTSDTFTFTFGSNSAYVSQTATKLSEGDTGYNNEASYSFSISIGDANWPFGWDTYLYLNTDNTVTFTWTVDSSAPLTSGTQTGSWSLDGTTITITFS